MITRTTLKTLWLAGGGLLATWLAVSPNRGALEPPRTADAQQSPSVQQTRVEDLTEVAERLRVRTTEAKLRQSTRNPFRFTPPPNIAQNGRALHAGAAPVGALPPQAQFPQPVSLTLSGIAERKTASGIARTAVVISDGQLYLVGAGDVVAGRYSVVSIEAEAVVLRDSNGEELRLVMRQ